MLSHEHVFGDYYFLADENDAPPSNPLVSLAWARTRDPLNHVEELYAMLHLDPGAHARRSRVSLAVIVDLSASAAAAFRLDSGTVRSDALLGNTFQVAAITAVANLVPRARLIDANTPVQAPRLFLPRQVDHEYSLDHYRGRFYVRSNKDGKNFGLYETRESPVDRWKAVIAPNPDVLLESYALFRDWLVLEERSKGLTRLRQINWQSGEQKEIAFDDPAYVTWLAYNPEPETSALRYGYSSMTTPSSTYELDMDSGKRTLLKQQPVAGFKADQYASERVWVTARDGVAVPVSLVYRKDKFKKEQADLEKALGF